MDDHDRKRFIVGLRAFNTTKSILLSRITEESIDEVEPHQKLVAILSYTLLNNHFHLCLKEQAVGGLTKYIRKLGTGYTLYFNTRHGRRGRLFERTIQKKAVTNDRYFQHLLAYIHLNSLDSFDANWRTGVIKRKQALEHLIKYPWSSAKAFLREADDIVIDWETLSLHYPKYLLKQHWKYLCGWSERNLAEVEPQQE